jgi:Domain of unknown function (DUF4333)
MRRGVVIAAGAGALAWATLAGCSFTPTVSAEDLQNDIKDRLTEAEETPESVRCKDDLEGVVGRTTRCEVVLSATNAFEPIVKVTKVEGTTVSFEMTPALSQQQLEKAVGAVVEENSSEQVDTVRCEGALEGKVGNKANCTVECAGETMKTVVEVSEVSGLLMNIEVNRT